MKKVLISLGLIGCLSLFAEQYGYKGYGKTYSDSSEYNNSKAKIERGFEKPGDANWNNMQIDKSLYGDKNNYQGSRPGDSDWGERNLKQLMDK